MKLPEGESLKAAVQGFVVGAIFGILTVTIFCMARP